MMSMIKWTDRKIKEKIEGDRDIGKPFVRLVKEDLHTFIGDEDFAGIRGPSLSMERSFK